MAFTPIHPPILPLHVRGFMKAVKKLSFCLLQANLKLALTSHHQNFCLFLIIFRSLMFNEVVKQLLSNFIVTFPNFLSSQILKFVYNFILLQLAFKVLKIGQFLAYLFLFLHIIIILLVFLHTTLKTLKMYNFQTSKLQTIL